MRVTGTQMLDNPIWHALTTQHAAFAEGNLLAKRYQSSFSPLAGLRHPKLAACRSLATLLKPNDGAGLFLEQRADSFAGLQVLYELDISQMVCEQLLPAPEHESVTLDETTVPEMMGLVELTNPGPFRERTRELGEYLGIRDGRTLAAMAGERLRLPGYTEISAVCTRAVYRGRGYARALVHSLATRIIARNEIPFLHVEVENTSAIRVYKSLGFRERRQLQLIVLQSVT